MSTQQIALFIAAGVAVWVYIDAKKNGYSTPAAIGWMLGVFLLMIVFLPIYLIMKAKRAKRPQLSTSCEFCRKHYYGNPNYCPHCGHMVRKIN
ncbi:MAG: hypothetical protein SCARUB_01438 [Candidatus Scalindua rubra]|uniref:Zinc ribbon domain-containing protein n=1 Tax=Candidatus Scalindua rubra TaxID=1872076 RepID=A0A1E3XCP5_9BACT|nr:MAG: hypothetical protein SCARUB_01438 [Candidatus Scalindua rubra]